MFPELGRIRQEDHGFKASLCYIVISCFSEKGRRRERRREGEKWRK